MNTILEFPTMSFIRAREIVAHPDLYRGEEILAACQALLEGGSVADMRAVLDLQKAGIVAGFEGAAIAAIQSRKARARRRRWEVVGGLYLLFAGALGTVALIAWLIQIGKAVLS
jgi:hypothetical protein